MPRVKGTAKTTTKGKRGTRAGAGTGTRTAAKKIMKRTTRGKKSKS
jgi:hypothetical protein